MPYVITRDEWLEIDGIPLATPAWEITDLSELLNGPDVRGSDRVLPGVAGVVALRRRVTVSVRTLPMVIYGDRDWNGDSYEDGHDGVETNLAYLVDNLCIPTDTGDGTLPAVLYLIGGGVRTADVHVLSPIHTATELGPAGLRATLDLSIPAGYFSESGS